MFDYIPPVNPVDMQYVIEYKIDISRIEDQNLELYSTIYKLQAQRFLALYNESGEFLKETYLRLILANWERHLEIQEERGL